MTGAVDTYAAAPVRGGRVPSPRTVTERRKRLGYWLAWRGAATEVSADELRAYAGYLAASNLGPSSQRDYLLTVLAFCRWRFARGEMADCTQDIPLPAVPAPDRQPLSEDELRRLWAVAELPDRVYLALALDTAMRAAELCGAAWNDLDTSSGRLAIIGKGMRRRIVWVSEVTLRLLAEWRERLEVLARLDDRILDVEPAGLRRRLRRLAHRAGIRPVFPHLLRHTSLTHHLRRGADIEAVRALAGHRQLTTTARYLHADEQAVQHAQTQAAVIGIVAPRAPAAPEG